MPEGFIFMAWQMRQGFILGWQDIMLRQSKSFSA
jgi:hypothetical protein